MTFQPQVSVNDFVSVNVVMSPMSIPYELFGIPLIVGDSSTISVVERFRTYSSIDGVGNDFLNTSPEFLAAEVFFEQEPQPATLFIGRWAATATPGQLIGAILTPTQQLLSNFTAITNGSFALSINGTAHNYTGINLSTALTINGVAAIIQTAVSTVVTGTTVVWNAGQSEFIVTSPTTGVTSTVSFASTLSSLGGSTDISGLLGWSSASGGFLSPGVAAESALTAVQALSNASSQWYGLSFATAAALATSDYTSVALYILASSRTRIFGVNILTTDCINSAITNDLATTLKALSSKRVFWMYSSSVAYPVMTMFGRAFTVDFNGNETTITLAYKQAPGVGGEYLTESQFATLVAKGGNVNVEVNNSAVMIWPGQMSNGNWFDEVHNVDWFANRVQSDVFNLLYTTTTKVPETDAGTNTIVLTIEASCIAAINNGMAGPGKWNADGFGSLQRGMTLTNGFYVFAPLVATQSEADREARKTVTIQVALKLQGAVHLPYVILNINR